MVKYIADDHTIYQGAPQMLIDRIHEVNALLANSKLKTGETESWKFWKKTSDIMKYSWDYMRSFEWLIQQDAQLRQENQYLRARNQHLEAINTSIIIIRKAKIQGNFEETVKFVDEMIEFYGDRLNNALQDVR
ncbi:MAG: hypothetical protein NTW16_01380 [Bacteroidetes bacterium]|nr:hypothetical protein [Bacteroidota bacterium]